jgi:hypothetical protein
MRPGEQRTVSLLFDPAQVGPGTPIEVATDPGGSRSRSGAVMCPSPVPWLVACERLMKAFLGPEVFDGTVGVGSRLAPASQELRLA